MREMTNKKGHKILEVSSDEVRVFGCSSPLCDICIEPIVGDKNYFVSVLNYVLCANCYADWCNSAIFYDEDKWYEDKKIDEVKCLLG